MRKHRSIPDDIDKNEELRTLISRCGGLPKVIVTVAESLGREFNWQKKAINLLEGKLVSELENRWEFACLRGLFSWMHIYLGNLPEDLKHHIAYLLIFPGNRSIRRRRLLMRWIAEGFSRDSDSYTANENGELLFSKLVELSMIHPSLFTATRNTRIVSYKVSNIFHEYLVTRPPEENIATAIEVFALRGTCSPTSRRRGRHLVIEQSWDRDKIVFENIDFSRLRSLTVFGKWDSFFITESMKVLRVLDLEDASGVTDKDLNNMLNQLRRLKFLSLRGCRGINYLPSSVGEIRQLQILDIRHTNIVTIPTSITKLKKLQYIRAGTSGPREIPSAVRTVALKLSELRRCLKLVGIEVMSGIGKLISLNTLGVVNVGAPGGKIVLKELRNLTQLRKLGVSGISKKNCKEFCSAVSCHSRLESLSVWLNKDSNICCFKKKEWKECLDGLWPSNDTQKSSDGMSPEITKEASQPPKKLESLKLYGLVKNIPKWIKMLNSLKKLNLEIDILSEDSTRVLGELPELCILRLSLKASHVDGNVSFGLWTDGVEECSYKKIKVLEVASRSELHLIIGLEAMQDLEVLRAGCSPAELLPMFGDLKHLSKLKEFCVIGSHDDTLKKFFEDQFAVVDTNKPILKFLVLHELNSSIQTPSASGGNSQTAASTGGNGHTKALSEGNDQTLSSSGGNCQTMASTGINDQAPSASEGNGKTNASNGGNDQQSSSWEGNGQTNVSSEENDLTPPSASGGNCQTNASIKGNNQNQELSSEVNTRPKYRLKELTRSKHLNEETSCTVHFPFCLQFRPVANKHTARLRLQLPSLVTYYWSNEEEPGCC